ncbi:hypothetical protein [Riemerella anatipestifer]|uniref:hypothetical protein n=1 Tax=Riemerella anatipestifer TaxID=34085 RepID=UPI000D691C42|nr:hypothetical protein [Riemerella anatipestifer]MBT0552419.1 hypothetical protein [Riemerella anatipestifer]MBT0554708.1 hypothetical protein [Riemerella anatipestifer]MCE3025182.1 hypothetical protein [Riemerella anatipestifer]MCU7542085.1 hypothetical protein [Riemerella anatipestifer]MCU7560812.1 hypothetical protein [Riemerella anatipestifer]
MKLFLSIVFVIYSTSKFQSQTIVNDNKEVNIIFPFEYVKYSLGTYYLFTIKNNSNFNYFIDTSVNSFWGRALILKNGKYLPQKSYYSSGYPTEREYNECEKDFQIIMKGETKNVLLPIFQYNGTYDFDSNNNYRVVISNQKFSRAISSEMGCKKYIEQMENKGYKLLEGNINLSLKIIE